MRSFEDYFFNIDSESETLRINTKYAKQKRRDVLEAALRRLNGANITKVSIVKVRKPVGYLSPSCNEKEEILEEKVISFDDLERTFYTGQLNES